MAEEYEAIRAEHPRAFEAWRPIDEVIIRAMTRASATVREMADRIGRTEAEVEEYLQRTGRAPLLSDPPSG